MERICIVFCEGQHDIAFVSRVLKVNGYVGYDKRIKQFIKPFDSLFKTNLESQLVSDRKLGYTSNYRVPSVSLCRSEERLVFFHNMGGDGKSTERKELIDMYKLLKGDDDFTASFNLKFRFVFLFDSDEKGVEQRILEINKELGFDNLIKNGELLDYEGDEWGAYVFHSIESGKGDLEDIIIEIVSNAEKSIIEQSKGFLDENSLPIDRTKEFICTKEQRTYKQASKYKHKKSLLSVAGQLQFSGMSNAVFIANSDFLSFEDLTSNRHCQAIANLFN